MLGKRFQAFFLLVTFFSAASALAADPTLFGPKTLTVGRWHVHVSMHRFDGHGASEGSLSIVKQTPRKKIHDGFVLVNGRFISLKRFFRGRKTTFETGVSLRSRNLLMVFMRGRPRAAIRLAITASGGPPPPTASLSANPAAIASGETSILTWSTQDADTCTLEPDIGAVATAGSLQVTPTSTTTYTLTATGGGGRTTAEATVTVYPVPLATLSASPGTIEIGQQATLTWTTQNTDTCTIDPGIGTVATSGSITVSPTEETVYTLTAIGPGGTTTATATVSVTYPPPTVSLAAAPDTILKDESAQLAWSSAYALSCTIEPGIGAVATSGSLAVTPAATTTYTIVSTGYESVAMASATVTVNDPAAPPTVSFTADPEKIPQGSSAVLTWTSFNGEQAHLDNGIGIVTTEGTVNVSPEHTTTYTLTISGPAGSVNAQVRVKVTGDPLPQPDGAFGQQYEDLIPEDATVTEYDPKRFAVVTGLVHDISGAPLSGVSVSIHDHPEYGTAATDETGRFSIPVEGGETLTIEYDKQGLIPSHRKISVPWNDIAVSKTIEMITHDTAATTIVFDGNPESIAVHRSTHATDSYGSRASTLVFSGDNHGYLLDKNGNDLFPLNSVTVRASEFSTPASMPAILPPTSAYTFCTELSVDGAQRVRFEKPVILWVENFIGFDVGEVAPIGYYDRDKSVWIPEKNGRVVMLLDTDADGRTDAIDADGDGLPDDLDENGSFADETAGLEDSSQYTPGSTFWRVAINHFSPHDINWAYAIVKRVETAELYPPGDSIEPNPKAAPRADAENGQKKTCPTQLNSYVTNRSRIYHEDIPIPGTNVTLHYASNRVSGYHDNILVPVSGETVPESLEKIIAKAVIAGKVIEEELSPLPYQFLEIEWDGTDYLEREPDDARTAHISIGFVYPGVYSLPPQNDMEQAFAMLGIRPVPKRARQNLIKWKHFDLALANPKALPRSSIAEGWGLSNHHRVEPPLIKGDGEVVENRQHSYRFRELAYDGVINAFAGTGSSGYNGDELPAIDADFGYPQGMAVDAAGNIFLADSGNNRIRKIDIERIITTVAGGAICDTGGYGGYGGVVECELGDGGPAADAYLNYPSDVAAGPNGTFYIADMENQRIRKVDQTGIITTVAGSGLCEVIVNDGYGGYYSYEEACSDGDNGPATEAHLNRPLAVTVDDSGQIYIIEGGSVVRKISPGGIISTLIGNGPGFEGDGGFASEARVSNPSDIVADEAGNIYIADTGNNRVRKIDPSGIITTVAGNGSTVFGGDGGPATEAGLNSPRGISLFADGSLYISDFSNQRIRGIDNQGIITTLAGNGVNGFDGDDGRAKDAKLSYPGALVVNQTGDILISSGNRIRIVSPPSLYVSEVQGATGDVFVESSGIGHVVSNGRHVSTMDMETGAELFSFDYQKFSIPVDQEPDSVVRDEYRLASVRDRFDREIQIQRDPDGKAETIVSPDGLITALNIDKSNHLRRITFPDGNYYAFEYSPEGLMTAEIDPKKNLFEHAFNDSGRLTDAHDEEGGHWQYTRMMEAGNSVRTEETTAEGNTTIYQDIHHPHRYADIASFETVITGPDGSQTEYFQRETGLYSWKILPCGKDIVTEYKIDDVFGFKFSSATTERNTLALQKETTRDRTYPDSDGDGEPDNIVDRVSVNGKTVTKTHDLFQSTKVQTSPEGRIVTSHYDPATLLTEKVEVPGLFDTDFDYDDRGRLTSTTADTRQTAFTYNASGFLASVTDPQNRVTRYSHDPVGRVTVVERPDGSTVGFSYDKNGNMTALTVPSGVEHRFFYTGVNLNSEYETPISGSYTYLYDRDRRLTDKIFPSGKRIVNVYDPARLIQIQTPEGNIDFTYLCANTIGSITQGGESIAYTYDGSLVTSESLSGTLGQALAYSYNNDFNVASTTYADGTVNFAYDDDGLLVGSGNFTIGRRADNGLPVSVTAGTLNLARSFNGHGEIASESSSVSGAGVYSWNAARDNVGRITGKSETLAGVTSDFAYTYDALGRLLTVTQDSVLVEEYRYNPDGTRSFEMNTARGITGRTFSYSDEEHLLTAGDATYQYDLNGFLTTKTEGTDTSTYDYGSRGELLSVSLPDGRYIEYVHDPLGRRIAKKIDGVITEKYLWQGLTRLLAVYDSADSLLMRFEYADGRMPIAMVKGGTRYYLTYDQVGSLRTVADIAGNVVKRIDYDAFGNILSDTNPAFEVPFGFAGGLHDRDTDLVRFGYRDYDPDTGRWTAKDPIFFDGGDTDLYGYVLNDPVDWADPIGLETWGFMKANTYLRNAGVAHLQPGYKSPPRNEIHETPRWKSDLGKMVVDQTAQIAAENLASKYITPVAGSALKKINFVLGFFDPFPPNAEAPTSPIIEEITPCH